MTTCKLADQQRRGLTLIETMIAMTISALIILAMAQAFQTISETVVVNRASVELAGQLRAASMQLQRDLAGLTVPTRPWAEMAGARGYFELYEGPDKDYYPNDTDPVLGFVDSSLGDIDDILMFTSRNVDEPFSGQRNGNEISSPDAEIVWCAGGEDSNGSGRIESNERYVYRRAFLIRPDLRYDVNLFADPTLASGNDTAGVWPNLYSLNNGLDQLRTDLENFYRYNDISVRIEYLIQSGNVLVGLVPNSLADLSSRRNRFAHYPILIDGPKLGALRPAARLVMPTDFGSQPTYATYPVFPYGLDVNPNSVTSVERLCSVDYRSGSATILSGVLGFDLQVYDPTAEIWVPAGLSVAVQPGDPAFTNSVAARINDPTIVKGRGTYVDLNYANAFALNGTTVPPPVASYFSTSPALRSGMSGTSSSNAYAQPLLVSYDTWCLEYERDGVNQDASAPPSPGNGMPPVTVNPLPAQLTDSSIDEGRNGFDDPTPGNPMGDGRVDELEEMETSPPYLAPLTGMRARLRVMDFDTRLVQQNTVVVGLTKD